MDRVQAFAELAVDKDVHGLVWVVVDKSQQFCWQCLAEGLHPSTRFNGSGVSLLLDCLPCHPQRNDRDMRETKRRQEELTGSGWLALQLAGGALVNESTSGDQ